MSRPLLLACLLASFIICPSVSAASVSLGPDLEQLKFVTQLTPEVPRRVSSIAFDGENFGGSASIRATTASMRLSILPHCSGRSVTNGNHAKPSVTCRVRSTVPADSASLTVGLWIGGSYGDSFGSIDPRDWKIENKFSVRQRDGPASQSYAGLAYDGNHLWIAWHWNKYSYPEYPKRRSC